jgi:hypothetical protein
VDVEVLVVNATAVEAVGVVVGGAVAERVVLRLEVEVGTDPLDVKVVAALVAEAVVEVVVNAVVADVVPVVVAAAVVAAAVVVVVIVVVGDTPDLATSPVMKELNVLGIHVTPSAELRRVIVSVPLAKKIFWFGQNSTALADLGLGFVTKVVKSVVTPHLP